MMMIKPDRQFSAIGRDPEARKDRGGGAGDPEFDSRLGGTVPCEEAGSRFPLGEPGQDQGHGEPGVLIKLVERKHRAGGE